MSQEQQKWWMFLQKREEEEDEVKRNKKRNTKFKTIRKGKLEDPLTVGRPAGRTY